MFLLQLRGSGIKANFNFCHSSRNTKNTEEQIFTHGQKTLIPPKNKACSNLERSLEIAIHHSLNRDWLLSGPNIVYEDSIDCTNIYP